MVELRIDDYEESLSVTNFTHRENAVKWLQDRIEQDYKPIIKEKGYVVDVNSELIFWCGYDGDYSRGSIQVEIIENEVL